MHFPSHVQPDAHSGPNLNRHHPALVRVPLVRAAQPELRNSNWANRVRRGLPEYRSREKTEGKLYDDSSHSWELVSGMDHQGKLTRVADEIIGEAIKAGFFNGAVRKFSRGHADMLRKAAAHVETKAAVWARQSSQRIIDVVTNRNYVCGKSYDPNRFDAYPGCFQAVELILRKGQTMRVWTAGSSKPVIIRGTT